jgi:hypothetical protein
MTHKPLAQTNQGGPERLYDQVSRTILYGPEDPRHRDIGSGIIG